MNIAFCLLKAACHGIMFSPFSAKHKEFILVIQAGNHPDVFPNDVTFFFLGVASSHTHFLNPGLHPYEIGQEQEAPSEPASKHGASLYSRCEFHLIPCTCVKMHALPHTACMAPPPCAHEWSAFNIFQNFLVKSTTW